ncbi:MAG TPA: acetate kinase [Longimicrobiaceae bacterium]|nr:acetate kinase [Longimicrobiaceae bacterium]
MNILVLNVGSSSLKFQLVDTDESHFSANTDRRLARGQIERIGAEAVYAFRAGDGAQAKGTAPLRDHRAAVEFLLQWIVGDESGVPVGSLAEIGAAGHRVVHGGERFVRSVAIDEDVLRGIEETIELAPLHNPANLKGIQAVRAVLGPAVPQVAVFDTAFHHTLPERAYLYAIPYSLYRRHRVRRYGFHGTSHRFVAYRYRQLTGRSREDTRIVTLHLGNGCSACAISGGVSVDTSMGFTPLEGLVMGTRSGDVDPAVLDYVAVKEGLSLPEVEALLNKQSGLLGISGLTNDMRELLAEAEEHDDRRAWLAIEIFCYRARKYLGSYLAALGGADAVVFTGGIGENSPGIRAQICRGLEWAGIRVDDAANRATERGREGRVSPDGAATEVWVIPTDEELLIARDTWRVVHGVETRY